jgi:hypothetical protein
MQPDTKNSAKTAAIHFIVLPSNVHPSLTQIAQFVLVRKIPTVSLLSKSTDVTIEAMESTGKRTVQVNVKMSAEDFATLQKAASILWPEAILSNSGIILGLAKRATKEIFKKKPSKHRS